MESLGDGAARTELEPIGWSDGTQRDMPGELMD